MMKFRLLLALLFLSGLFACTNTNNGDTVETDHKDSTAAAKQPFDGVVFASKKDVACGMMLSAGVTDTAHYNGKVYGFCSKECKADFLKTPDAFLASKYRQ